MKAYMLKCLETKKIIRNKHIVFIRDNESITNNSKMHPSGRNESSIMVMVEKSSRLFLFEDCRKSVNCNEQVRGDGVVIEEAREGHANDDIVEGFV
jgi:hypothetical protein